MALSPHTKDVHLMTSLVVAIVAFAGLAMIYSDNSTPIGAAVGETKQLMSNAVDAGKRCGECALQSSETKNWDYKKCPLMDSTATQFGVSDQRLTYQCCKNECERLASNVNQDYYTRQCGQICKGSADCAFGYCRLGGGYPQ
ncbi:MAG: hypothetical protein AABX47_04515 [Nanoarchaeota archaeon]